MAQPIDPDRRTMLFIRIGLSVVVLGVSLFIVLSQKFSSDYTKWAFGMIGLVVGYWLR
jgi:uncharacterized membrane protein